MGTAKAYQQTQRSYPHMSDPIVPEPTPTPAAPAYSPAPAAAGPKQALSLTSFITGIAGIVFSAVPGLGFLASLAGVILGFIGKKREPAAPKWMATVGIITGFVGIALSIIFTIVLVVLPLILVGTAGSYVNTY
jgi:hypothetical protein